MIAHLLDTVGPVFLLVTIGFLIVRGGLLDGTTVDALMRYAVRFAIPCLLFRAVSTIDLGAAYDWRAMVAYYGAAALCFGSGALLARRVFGRRPGEAVAVGFVGLFSNTLLLGLPVIELSLGEAALPTAYAVISVHASFCYLLGIVAMETLRADGRSLQGTAAAAARAMFRNALMIGVALGFAVNLSRLPLPGILTHTLDMVAGSALPIALIGLGGVMTRFGLSTRIAETATITAISLVLHPLLALAFCTALDVTAPERDVIVLLAAMAPGVNVYLFANLYGRAEDTAAGAVLLGTIVSAGSVGAWAWWLTGG